MHRYYEMIFFFVFTLFVLCVFILRKTEMRVNASVSSSILFKFSYLKTAHVPNDALSTQWHIQSSDVHTQTFHSFSFIFYYINLVVLSLSVRGKVSKQTYGHIEFEK